MIAAKVAELKETINLRRTKGFEAAQAVVITDVGKNKMKDIRSLIEEMLNEEDSLLNQGTDAQQASFQNLRNISILGIFLAFLFSIFTGLLVRQVDIHIDERKKAEELLRKSEELYRSLFNSIDEGFCIIEMIFDENNHPNDYLFLQISPSFEKQSGLKDAQGKRILEIAPKHEKYWFDIFGKIALTGEPLRFENYAEALGRWFDVYAFRFGDPENRQVAILFNDVTERTKAREEIKKKSEELERSNQELEQFAYVASHDLQEPLRMVASFTQKLEQKYKDRLDAQANEYIDFAVDGAKRMQILIDDLLSFSRDGQKDAPRGRVDLNKIVQQIQDDMKISIAENQATIDSDPLPVLNANETQMAQLFLNLISNGLKYRSERSPIIRITSKNIGERQWQFSVSDNGIGIEEKYFGKLFIIFQRLHTKKEYKGTGIGLALCKKIAENYNGRIWLESKIGEGTTFRFILNEGEGA